MFRMIYVMVFVVVMLLPWESAIAQDAVERKLSLKKKIANLLAPQYQTQRGYTHRLLKAFRLFQKEYGQQSLQRKVHFSQFLPSTVPLGGRVSFASASEVSRQDPGYHKVNLKDSAAPKMQCLPSKTYPLQVCYFNDSDKDFAQKVLERAEIAWKKQVVDLGYYPPYRGPDKYEPITKGLNIYIDKTKTRQNNYTAYGYVAPVEENPQTTHRDMISYMMIGRFTGQINYDELQLLIHHELNHACQLAMDYTESTFAKEASSQWIQSIEGPTDSLTNAAADTFQNNPQFPICFYTKQGSLATYQYGGFLFLRFLYERYAQKDLTWVRRVWEKAVQPASKKENEPDFFDAIQSMLKEKKVTLQEAIKTFGPWRYFVGSKATTGFFEYAKHYPPVRVTPIDLSGLKKDTPTKKSTGLIHEWGYRFIELTGLSSTKYKGYTLSISTGTKGFDWAVTAYILKGNEPGKALPFTSANPQAKSLTLSAEQLEDSTKVLLILANLGTAKTDPDNYLSFIKADFSLQAEVTDEPAPSEPSETSSSEVTPQEKVDGGESPNSPDASHPKEKKGASDSATPPSGCGCALSSSNSESALLYILGILLFVGFLKRRREIT